MEAAGWDAAAARADRLPTLRLAGSAQLSDDTLHDLIDNWSTALAAGIAGPILDGGRRRAEVERTRAVQQERLAAYRDSVLSALEEVDNAIVREQRQVETIRAIEEQLGTASATRDEAARRYRLGQETYLPVLSALLTMQDLERSLIDARYERLTYRVALHRALGGDWMGELTYTENSNLPESDNE
jgi:outer membrane protein TolC